MLGKHPSKYPMQNMRRAFNPMHWRVLLLSALALFIILIVRTAKNSPGCLTVPKSTEQGSQSSAAGTFKVSFPAEVFAPAPPAPHNIAICSLIRNEATYVAEWIIYHHLLGVDTIYLFDNGSEDNLEEVLEPFIAKGWVVLNPLPPANTADSPPDYRILPTCTEYVQPHTRWLGMFDPDEFLTIAGGNATMQLGALRQKLPIYEGENCAGVIIDRATFSSGGQIERPPKDALVIETYTEREVSSAPQHEPFGKTLHFTERVNSVLSHTVNKKDDWRVCLADAGDWTAGRRSVLYDPMRFNHYQHRSKEECLKKIDDLIAHGDSTWRVLHGKEACEKAVHGGDGYVPHWFTEDLTLAASDWPQLIRAFQEQLPFF